MTDHLKAIMEAAKILNETPVTGEWAYITKQTWLHFGGTEESWNNIPGNDGAKLVRYP